MADYKVMGKVYEVDEVIINENIKDFEISKADAVRMYFEDMGIIEPSANEEIVEVVPTKAKRKYTKSDKPRKKSTRERKVDEEKKEILGLLIDGYTEKYPRVVKVKNEVEFSFTHNGNEYTVKLIKHRPPKNA